MAKKNELKEGATKTQRLKEFNSSKFTSSFVFLCVLSAFVAKKKLVIMNIEQGISNNEGRFSFVFLRSLLPLWRKKSELKEGATKTQRLKEFNSSKFTSSFVFLCVLSAFVAKCF